MRPFTVRSFAINTLLLNDASFPTYKFVDISAVLAFNVSTVDDPAVVP